MTARGSSPGRRWSYLHLEATELRPEPFQERLPEKIALAQLQGHHRNRLVSAIKTGKTVTAVLDQVTLRENSHYLDVVVTDTFHHAATLRLWAMTFA